MTDKITFIPDDQEEAVSFYILDEAKLGGVNYLLVTDEPVEEQDGDDGILEGAAYIMKDLSSPEDAESVYRFVEDDNELSAVCELFKDTLDELGIELEEE